MSNFTFEAQSRTEDEKMLAMRRVGIVPAVLYGAGMDNVNLKISRNAILKFYKEVGESTVIDLNIDGKNTEKVLIKKIQIEGLRNSIIHVDFFRPSDTKKVIVKVPLIFSGISKTVKEMGGMQLINMEMVKVRCFAKDLLRNIPIDLSVIESFSDKIRVKDLKVSENVEIMDNPNNVIASTASPKVLEAQEAAAAAEDEKKEEAPVEGDAKEEDAKEVKEEKKEKK